MSKREIDKDMIPVNSAEAYAIQMKLIEKALAIFEKHNVNMPVAKVKYPKQTCFR